MITIIVIILIVVGAGILIWNNNRSDLHPKNSSATPELTQTNMDLSTSLSTPEKEQFVFEKNGESHISKDGLTITFNNTINKRLRQGPEITSYFFTLSLNGEKRDVYFSNQNLSIQWSGFTISKEDKYTLTLSVQKK